MARVLMVIVDELVSKKTEQQKRHRRSRNTVKRKITIGRNKTRVSLLRLIAEMLSSLFVVKIEKKIKEYKV
jgi:hypothetical protein